MIYDVETAGVPLWTETQTVNIQKGIFSVLLGGVMPLNLAFDKPYFLEIKVGTEVMSPRQRIASAAYAFRADTAQNSDKVNGVAASATPEANKLLALDAAAKIPTTVFKKYDSGWFAVSTAQAYSKIHNLGTTNAIFKLYFATDINGSNMMLCEWFTDETVNDRFGGTLKSITATTIVAQTGRNAVQSTYDTSGNWQTYVTGYYRIIGFALE